MSSNPPDPEVEAEPAGGYVELECVDSPFSDSSSSSSENDESENDDLDLDRAEDAAEAHVPRMGVNPYMFEPVLAEEAHPREEPAAANPANQDRLRVLDWCQCDNCTLMQTVEESICCREYQQIVDTMEETDTPDACLTRHEAYNRIVLCPFVLKVAYIGYSTRERRQMPQDQNG
ncbi:hypothetical protein HOLleu_31387 [Holothuria leucospilota]|uniref:P2X purinoreceptor 7 intracellular domain-containing protein n=1 Tax=Holothuria leucospilota TaxID=206669 RepID=A0A9Q0YQB5_HOLLE|nr:hypothetical protein HOLleu_31387 [Holothuria leucospilota]